MAGKALLERRLVGIRGGILIPKTGAASSSASPDPKDVDARTPAAAAVATSKKATRFILCLLFSTPGLLSRVSASYCAFTQVSGPGSMTDTSEKKILTDFPLSVPARLSETSRGPESFGGFATRSARGSRGHSSRHSRASTDENVTADGADDVFGGWRNTSPGMIVFMPGYPITYPTPALKPRLCETLEGRRSSLGQGLHLGTPFLRFKPWIARRQEP